jgi:glutaryl-CoA dehydrogenase (non-decarboxylating)
MDFKLPKEHQMLQKAVRDFCKKQIAPNVEEWDKNHYFPYEEVMKPMGELGFWGTVIPEEYGGEDMGFLAAMIVTEELARVCSSLRVQVNMQVLGCAFTIFRYGTEEVKKKYIEGLCAGELIGGFGITEPMPAPTSWPWPARRKTRAITGCSTATRPGFPTPRWPTC